MGSMETIRQGAQAGPRRGPIDKRSVAGSFGRAAASYDAHAALQRQVADRLLDGLAPSAAPLRILDLGSGTGYCGARLRERFPAAQLVALDLSPAMLRQAMDRRPGGGIQPICADAEALPFTAHSFDLVVSSLTMQWCAEERLLRELGRAARPGARCLLSTFGPATLRELKAAWAQVDDYVHVNEFRGAAALERELRQAGFSGAALRPETQRRHYGSLRDLGAELKAIGAHNMNRGQPPGLTGRGRLRRLQEAFERGRVAGLGIPVTWEVFYLDLTV